MSRISSAQLQRFNELEATYRPSDAVLADLQERVQAVTILSGPQAVGKTSVQAELSDIASLQNFTTRPARPGEHLRYAHRPDSQEEYDKILADLEAGELVQCQVGLGNFVYGNYPSGYSALTLADMSPSASLKLAELPFRTHHVMLVAPSEDYLTRFYQQRVPQIGALRAAESLDATMHTLAYALRDPRFIFVNNPQGELLQTAEQIRAITTGSIDSRGDAAARQIGCRLLERLEESAMTA